MLLLLEMVVVGLLQGKQSQLLLRVTQGKDKQHCHRLQHTEFPLHKKKQRFTTRIINYWDRLPRQIVISILRELKTHVNKA